MIKIQGSVRRSFIFPAELPLAFAYYSDLSRVLPYLPHISLVRVYDHNHFRVLYNSTELQAYHIRVYCDVQAQLDGEKKILYVNPSNIAPPVETSADAQSTTGQGRFSSRAVFRGRGAKTRIEYSLQLEADLPPPLGLRLMPGVVVNRIARNVTRRRMREIIVGFIERSMDAFPYWLDEMGQ